MAGQPKKRRALQKLIAEGELPPDETMIKAMKCLLWDTMERFYQRIEDGAEVTPGQAMYISERITHIITQIKAWGGDISDLNDVNINVPGLSAKEDEGKDDTA